MMIGAGVQHAGDFVPRHEPLPILDARRRRLHSVERVFVDQLPPQHRVKERTGRLQPLVNRANQFPPVEQANQMSRP